MAEEEKIEAEDGEEGGNGKGKLFLIIGVVALLLIGGGAAFFLLGGEEAPVDGEATEEAADAVEEDGEKIAAYHAIPKTKEPGMVISLLPGTNFKQVQLSIRVFTYSPELVEYLEKNDPMLRHHIVNLLGTQESAKFIDRAGRESLQIELKDMFTDLLTNSKVEEEQKLAKKIEDVYFTEFILQ